jgi:biotin transport system substrate-specific component
LKTASLVKTALLAALMASTAIIAIPIGPVPITLQTFFALLSGAVLGPVYGAASMSLYVLLGAIGLPVFSKGQAGLGVLLGPTGGYIIGFVAAAYFVGLITSKGKKSFLQIFLSMLTGIAIIYLFGVIQIVFLLKITLTQAIAAYVVPFIPLDIVKAVVAAEIARRLAVLEISTETAAS